MTERLLGYQHSDCSQLVESLQDSVNTGGDDNDFRYDHEEEDDDDGHGDDVVVMVVAVMLVVVVVVVGWSWW